jgi:shikimate dehydrogenase
VPHKQAAFAIAHECDAAARAAGAANLLVFGEGGRIFARNTDASGLAASLKEKIGALDSGTAVLLGAGGAARGAVLALDELGAGTIRILNRDSARADALAQALASQVRARLASGNLESWPQAAGGAALLVNATSAGMTGHAPLAIDLAPLPESAAVCDIVYNPLQTTLLKDAAARGHVTIDGLGMLMHQAVPSFEAFFGVRPAVTPGLRAALVKVLSERA